jgi:hypothetical protein
MQTDFQTCVILYEVKTVIYATEKSLGSHNHVTRICSFGGLCDFSIIIYGQRHDKRM